MDLNVLDINGKETKQTAALSDAVFAITPNDHAIWLDVRSIRANQRQGTQANKNRSAVSGGGKKPFRQKGTGRARQGSSRAPHHVGGGRAFSTSPRTYTVGITKKVKTLARKSALSYKAQNNDVLIVDNFKFDEVSASEFKKFLAAMNLDQKNVLFLTLDNEQNLYLSSRNMYKVEMRHSNSFSTYDVMRAEKLVVQEGALNKINEVLG